MIRSHRPGRRERGVVLLFGLVVMVALALAAVGIIRSVATGTLVIGGIAFKGDTTSAASTGAEAAIDWLKSKSSGNALDSDDETAGYYASSIDTLDPTGNRTTDAQRLRIVKWGGKCATSNGAFDTCNTLPAGPIDVNGNRVEWVITRLCAGPGSAGGANPCAMPVSASVSHVNDRGQVGPEGRLKDGSTTPYFRIVVRVEGPRQTVSTIEQIVHF